MSRDMLQSFLQDQGIAPDEQELLLDAWERVVAGWGYHGKHIRRQGGHFVLRFTPGLGRVDLDWSSETIKKGKRQ